MGFIATGLFYGAISALLGFIFGTSNHLNPFEASSSIENIVLVMLLTLVLISVGMGKHIEERVSDFALKFITAVLCLINLLVVVFVIH